MNFDKISRSTLLSRLHLLVTLSFFSATPCPSSRTIKARQSRLAGGHHVSRNTREEGPRREGRDTGLFGLGLELVQDGRITG